MEDNRALPEEQVAPPVTRRSQISSFMSGFVTGSELGLACSIIGLSNLTTVANQFVDILVQNSLQEKFYSAAVVGGAVSLGAGTLAGGIIGGAIYLLLDRANI